MNNYFLETACKTIAFHNGYRDAFNPCDTSFSKNNILQDYLVLDKLKEIIKKETLSFVTNKTHIHVNNDDNTVVLQLRNSYNEKENLILILYQFYRVLNKIPQLDPCCIRMSKREMTVSDLMNDVELSDLYINEYTASLVIESLLIKIPVKEVYIDLSGDYPVIIQGFKSLYSIKSYIEGEFVLSELEFLQDLEGKKFNELPRNYQRRILESYILVRHIEKGTSPSVISSIVNRIKLDL